MPTMLMSAAPLLQQQQQQQFKQQPLHQDLHQAQPTFNWTGVGRQQGSRIHYDSFNFADELYLLGDCVYLLPEEEGAPPYIARLLKAWEDTVAPEPEKLVIEVQWFERRCSVPGALAAAMHEREVVESDLTDTNLVGCIDRKAVIVKAHSYAEALEQLPAGRVKGDWHFCRGILQSDAQVFRTYKELGHQLVFDHTSRLLPQDALNPLRFNSTGAGHGQTNGNGSHMASGRDGVNACQNNSLAFDEDDEMEDEPAPAPPKKAGGKGGSAASRSRRAAAAARVAAATAAAAAAGGGNVSRGVPGKVCCECGATQTPQWREGPMGPKTLCNACGVRYQRSQSKAKTNKRLASERAREQRSHSPVAASGSSRGQKAARVLGGSSTLATATAAAAAAAGADITGGFGADGPSHHHGTRSRASGTIRLPQQQQQQQRGRGRPPCGSKQHQQHLLVQHQLQQAHASSFGAEQHYYEDEGSPPNINTAILDVEEEEGAQRQPLKDALHRSATQDAADVLQQLSTAPQQQRQHLPQRPRQQPLVLRDQQQLHDLLSAGHPHQQSASSAFCSSIIGSPATMLLPDQLQHDGMPLLSLDDKLPPVVNRPGSPDGLIGISTSSLSPIQPRQARMGAGAAGVAGSRGMLSSDGGSGRPSMAAANQSATCASPGKLISSMLQGLKMPQPLNLNGPMPLPPLPSVTAALPAAAVPVAGRQQQQFVSVSTTSQQPWPPLANGSSDVASKQQPGGLPQAPSLTRGPSSGTASINGSSNSSMPLVSQLQSLVYRASAFVPDVMGLSGLYPGAGSQGGMQHMVRQLEQLPLSARQQLQQASSAVEETISRAKAAEAAVLAVTQVLAAKKQAAADARAEVDKSMQLFRQTLSQFGPSVAAAVAGHGSSTCGDEPAVLPSVSSAAVGYLASGIGGEAAGLPGHAAVVSAAVPASGADCLTGSSRLGGSSPRVLVSQAPVLGGQDFGEVNCLGGAAEYSLATGAAMGPGGLALGDASDADDLLRDPYAAEDAVNTAPAVASPAVVKSDVAELQQALKTEQQQQQQQCVANDQVPDQQQLDQQKPKQQQVAVKQDQQQQHPEAKQEESMVQQQGQQQLVAAMATESPAASGAAAAGMPPQQQPPTPGSDLLTNGSSGPSPPAAAAPAVATSAPLVPVSAPPSAAHAMAETAPVAA